MHPTPTHRLIVFQPRDTLDRLFAVSVVIKGLDGLVELVAGLALLLITPPQVEAAAAQFAGSLVGSLLPDAVSAWAVTAAEHVTITGLAFGASYLLAHGVVKVVLVGALLRNKLWAYPLMIAVLIGFLVFQGYQLAHRPSAGLVVLSLFDVVVLVLTWREFHRQRSGRRALESATTRAASTDEGTAQARLSVQASPL